MSNRQQSVPESDFWKSVRNLEALAKGGGGDTGTQIAQGRQKPHSHPNDSVEVMDDYDGQNADSYSDIERDGTDYNQRSTLAHKVMKGEALSSEEIGILKGDIEYAAEAEKSGEEAGDLFSQKVSEDDQFGGGMARVSKADDDDDDKDDKGKGRGCKFCGGRGCPKCEEEDKGVSMSNPEQWNTRSSGGGGGRTASNRPAAPNANPNAPGGANTAAFRDATKEGMANQLKRSFESYAVDQPAIRDGVEISDFLSDMVKAIGMKFEDTERAIRYEIRKSVAAELASFRDEQGEFNKSLAEATVGIAHQVAGATEDFQKAVPARGPKSVQGSGGVRAVEKAFAGGPEVDRDATLSALTEMVVKGQASSLDVVRFETTGLIEPALMQKAINVAKSMGLAN